MNEKYTFLFMSFIYIIFLFMYSIWEQWKFKFPLLIPIWLFAFFYDNVIAIRCNHYTPLRVSLYALVCFLKPWNREVKRCVTPTHLDVFLNSQGVLGKHTLFASVWIKKEITRRASWLRLSAKNNWQLRSGNTGNIFLQLVSQHCYIASVTSMPNFARIIAQSCVI